MPICKKPPASFLDGSPGRFTPADSDDDATAAGRTLESGPIERAARADKDRTDRAVQWAAGVFLCVVLLAVFTLFVIAAGDMPVLGQ